jgi:hypothetical protein
MIAVTIAALAVLALVIFLADRRDARHASERAVLVQAALSSTPLDFAARVRSLPEQVAPKAPVRSKRPAGVPETAPITPLGL